MRKFLLLMFALLAGVSGAWAENNYFLTTKTAVTSITSGNYYVIDGRDQVGSKLHFLFDNGTKVTSNDPQDIPSDPAAVGKFVWKIVGNSTDGYTLQNLATGNYMSLGASNGSQISSSDTPQTNGIYFAEIDNVTYATILNSNGQAIDIGAYGNNPTTWGGTTTPGGSRRLVLYEVVPVVISDDACYTIDFVSKNETKTWGLRAATSETTANASGTGDVFVAHSYTNLAGNKRWIFVNNSDGTYLKYHGVSTSTFDLTNAVNEWNLETLTAGSGNVSADAPVAGKLCITNDYRGYGTYPGQLGTYILSESTGNYDNAGAPYYNGSFTSALKFTATGDAVSAAATLAIAKFDALNEVRGYLTYAGNISALFANPTSIEANINAAETAEAAATVATNFMKSPEGKKFYANPSTATTQYMNIGESQITATATKLYAEAALEVEYAGNGKYYLKGVKSGYYAGNPISGNTNPGTVSAKGSATPLYIGNYANSVDNVVYFARTKTGSYIEAIHYSTDFQAQGRVVAWTYNVPASQWNITAISDEDYEALCHVCDVTYKVILAASGEVKATETQTEVQGSPLTVPASIAKDFCSYRFYTDAACTSSTTVAPTASSAEIYALVNEVTTPFTASADYASATWYNLKMKDAYPSYVDGTPNVTLPATPSSTENNVEWAFIGNPYDGYQIINKGAGDGYELSSADDNQGTTGDGSYAIMTNEAQTYNRWYPKSSSYATNGFYLYNSANHALNKRSADNLAYWTGGADAGSTFTVSAVTDNTTELTEIANILDDYTYGSAFGEYGLSGIYAGHESEMATSIIPGLKGTYSYEHLLTARGLQAATYINVPNNQFIKIKGVGNRYLTMGEGSTRMTFTTSGTILYYSGNKLISYSNGLYAGMSTKQGNYFEGVYVAAMGSAGMDYTFTESTRSPRTGNYKIGYVPTDNIQRYMYATNSEGGNADQYKNNDDHDNCVFSLEAVTSLPVTITSVGYATLYAPVALTIPSGVTAYIASDEGEYLHLTAIDGGIIPANTGVILAGTPDIYSFDITTGGSVSGNALTGTVAAIARPENSYILSTSGGTNVGFYKDGASDIPGFKAYLPAAGGSSVKAFRFSDADAIESIVNDQLAKDNAVIYNLAGQRINKLQKGVNIINGKKVLVK